MGRIIDKALNKQENFPITPSYWRRRGLRFHYTR